MDAKLQQQIAFFLTGRREGSKLRPLDGRFRPALFSRYSDLSSLRYDFPLVLNCEGGSDRAVSSLSRLVDDAVKGLGENSERDRIARHGYRLESEVRRDLTSGAAGDFGELWKAAGTRLAQEHGDEILDSAHRLWKAFNVSGDLVDADTRLPASAVRHAWRAVEENKAKAFRQQTGRLLFKLRQILDAEIAGSREGRTPDRLKSGVGSSFESAFDFDAMSRLLDESKPGTRLSEARRERIREIIVVLERQRFYRLEDDGPEPHAFEFDRCFDAREAYCERHAEAVELAKAIAVAKLEVRGDYRDGVHDVLFESFGANGLDADALAQLPFYLVCTDGQSLDPAETAEMVGFLAAGLPIKVLVRTDDVLEPSAVAEGHIALGLRARQLVDTAIGLTDVFVFQSCASQLFRMRDSLLRGLSYNGPALFSVFSGSNNHTGDIPAYLVAAAAAESRVFPALVYDPSAGSDWASRLRVGDNPKAEDDWPVHAFAYEDPELQSRTERLAFTLADFMAMDERFFRHFAIVPAKDWSEAMITVPEALDSDEEGLPEKVPSIALVDEEGNLERAVLDSRTLTEVSRCRTMWHSLQELGGIHNSHAERLLDQERKAMAAEMAVSEEAARPGPVPAEAAPAAAEPEVSAEVTVPKPAASEVKAVEPAAEEMNGDEPYIETPRCTTCNECTEINGRMFAYNDNKQAYIADPDAGTYRQLVEAAESCQVAIIHPGKPRNPKEPGLDDLISRAAEFK